METCFIKIGVRRNKRTNGKRGLVSDRLFDSYETIFYGWATVEDCVLWMIENCEVYANDYFCTQDFKKIPQELIDKQVKRHLLDLEERDQTIIGRLGLSGYYTEIRLVEKPKEEE